MKPISSNIRDAKTLNGDFYNSTNYSLEEKLLYAVNKGNAYYVIELIGNGALTKDNYQLLLDSALSR